ncbi:hypothetical protein V502_04925 [Pseudogymnoascus sp. VKM F-4520 (FW-2644)]|nr:hypothetical protein V502_04925 [Pseudogymnoascus sp. VKM F-4520 (FW-2644)]
MKLLATSLAVLSAVPLALGFTTFPSVEPLPVGGIFARQEFIEKRFCYPVQEVKSLRPGKTVDVNKLIELVKVETNDVLMDSKDIVVTALQLAEEINELSVNCNDGGLTAGVKSSKTGYTITVGSIGSIQPGWSCA